MKVFGSSGIRGVANESLTPEYAVEVAMAAGSRWRAAGDERVAVAHDTRRTGTMFADAVGSGLASVGLDVESLGTLPTPAAQAYAEAEGVPAVVVTASHNPSQHNGIKLIGTEGIELPVAALEDVEERLLADAFDRADWDDVGGSRTVEGVAEDYVAEMLAAVDRERVADADLTVAVDPGHGAGAVTSPDFFRELGCDVLTVNAQPDGHFPGRPPEPVEENLGDLQRLVRNSEADLGVAHDGDADRAVFVDETGAYVEGDAALAALAEAELTEGDAVVSAVSTSQRLVDVADRAGADLYMTPIGSSHIVTRIRELQRSGRTVPVAGEGNGGIIFPGYRTVRDGAYTAARFCELLAERPASAVVADYDDYHNVRVDVEYEDAGERERMVDAVKAAAGDTEADLDTTDGYRLNYDDGWVLARPSGTEPLLRIYAEARSDERAAELADWMHDAVLAAKN